MPKKIYFHLLILCEIWSQGIIGICADDEITESSADLLVREKRVVSRLRGEDKAVSIKNVPYVAFIKHNDSFQCMGTILSHYIVITSTLCAQFEASEYDVVAGTGRTLRGRDSRDIQDVIEIRKHYGNLPGRPSDGIALLIVHPSFDFGAFINFITLHSGPLLPDIIGTISGLGFNCIVENRGTAYPNHLRSIEVPIMAHQDCINIYRPHQLHITDKDVCTYHTHRHCGHIDGGAPLVVDGHLAGVRLWSGLTGQHDPNFPDVFIMVQHSEYNQWIRNNIENVYLRAQNQHA